MPKARTGAQRAASRRNLVKARASRRGSISRSRYTGKTMMLVHSTQHLATAKKIVAQGFKPHPVVSGMVFAFNHPGTKAYGKAQVSFKASRKKVKPDWTGEKGAVMVHKKHITGVRVKR